MHVIDIYIHYTYITYIMFVFYSYGYRLSLRVIQLPKNEMKQFNEVKDRFDSFFPHISTDIESILLSLICSGTIIENLRM